MKQYSVYIRPCSSYESVSTHIQRIRFDLPPRGEVSILTITDKQFSKSINYIAGEKPQKKKRYKDPPANYTQLELF